jgi:hypothetical protein
MIYRPVRRISDTTEQSNLLHRITNLEIDNAREIVLPDKMFMSEHQVRKPFRLLVVDEWLYHRHGAQDERTCSAKVFHGGFRCYGCNRTYVVPHESSFEEPYLFTFDQTKTLDDPTAYMPDIDWKEVIKRKMAVVNAPMGAGKTEQLSKLVDHLELVDPDARILVISFREVLARQQASRL